MSMMLMLAVTEGCPWCPVICFRFFLFNDIFVYAAWMAG
jgi:hypothetical protein